MIQENKGNNESEIRILIVEDLFSNAELVQREIKLAGIDFISLIVDNKNDFASALYNFKPNIILSDYMLPKFNAMNALQLAKKYDPLIPFIIVTGSMNEETAVECMKAGADDYVIKEHISRIGPSIRDSLENRSIRLEKEKTEERLQRSEEDFRLIAENITDMIVVLDLNGIRMYNSPSYKNILGDTELLRGTDSFQDIYYEDREKIKKIFFETVSTGIGQRAEYRLLGKDGKIYFIESQGSVIKDANGKVVNVIVVSRDITQRKIDEKTLHEKEEFLDNIIENIPHLIYIKDAKDLRYVRVNKAFELEWGFKRDELVGKNDYDFFPKNEADFYTGKDSEVLIKKQIISIPEETIHTKFVGKRILHTKKIPILNQEGNPQFLLGISEDITVRKQEEKELQSKTTFLETLLNSSYDGILVVDDKGRKVLQNQRFIDLFNIPVYVANGDDYKIQLQYIVNQTKDPEEYMKKFRNIYEHSREVLHDEIEFKNGLILERYSSPIIGRDGKYYGSILSFHDITKRKRSEEALVKEQYLTSTLMDNIPDNIYFKDAESRFIRINKALMKQFNLNNPDQSVGKTDFDFFTLDHAKPAYENEQEIIRTGKPLVNLEEKETWPDGRVTWVSTTKVPLRDSKGQIIGTFGISRDITERKRVEEAVRESEERFRMVFENVFDGISIYSEDPDPAKRKLIECNERYAEMAGRSRKELLQLGNTIGLQRTLEDTANENRLESLAKEKEYKGTFSWIRPDGKENIIEYVGVPIKWRGKALTIGIDRDITERRRIGEALQNERLLLRTLIDNIPDLIYSKDHLCRKTLANLADVRNMGAKSEADVMGKDDFAFYTKEMAERFFNDDRMVIQKGEPIINREEYIIDEKGEKQWLLTSKLPLRDKDNQIIGLVGIGRDITEHKRAEEALQESELRFRSLYENATIGIYRTTPDGNILLANPALIKMLGFTSFERLAEKNLEKDGFESSFQRKKFIEKIERDGEVVGYDSKWIRQDGKNILVLESARAIRDSNGKTLYYDGTVEDITERKRAEEALRESEERMRDIIFSVGEWVWEVDENGKYTYSSKKVQDFLGYTLEDIIGKTPFDFMPPDEVERVKTIFSEIVMNNSPIKDLENWNIRKDGERICLLTNGVPIHDENGNLRGYRGVDKDITERKRAEEQINLLAHTVRSVSECVSITDLNDTILFINDAFLTTYGYTKQEILGKNIEIVRSLNNQPDLANDIHNSARDAGWHGELLNQTKDGREFPVFLSTSVVRDDQGRAVALVGVASDITERKQVEQALKESEERYRFIVEATSDVIYQIRYNSTKYDFINPTIEKLTGYSPDEINSIGFTSIIEKVKKLNDEKAKVSATHGKIETDEWRTDYQIRTKAGELIWISDTSYPWVNESGVTIGRIGIMRDITDRILAQEEIIKAKEKAEEMNRLKSNFLANMSHELRTPLIGIIGFADMLKEESKGKEEKEMVETILESGNRLSETLNLILDLSKVEAETIKVNLEEIELNDFIQNQVNSFKKTLRKKNVKLKLKLPNELIYSNLDKVLLTSILSNLLNNAFKYTSRGEVIVSLKKITQDDREIAEISVKDTGIGIAKENLETIFEPFRQVSEGYTRKFEGTGLGLTLVKKYVKSMNGEIMVESELEKGSVFNIKFNIVKSVKEKKVFEMDKNIGEPSFEKPENKIPLLLYAEDDLNTRTVIRKYVDIFCNIDCVSNGTDAVKFARMKKYDLILMDINLGKGLNGLDAVSNIRKIPGYQKIPIVAVTAYALAGDREKFMEHGCSHYISKPFIKEQLISLLKGILNLQLAEKA